MSNSTPSQGQKRQSCEACRSKKLRCSGQEAENTKCLRCRALSINCRFHTRGAPGRPRKRLGVVAGNVGGGPLERVSTSPVLSSPEQAANKTWSHSPPSRNSQPTTHESSPHQQKQDQLQPQPPPPQQQRQRQQQDNEVLSTGSPPSSTNMCGIPADLSYSILQGLPPPSGMMGMSSPTTVPDEMGAGVQDHNMNCSYACADVSSRSSFFEFLEPWNFNSASGLHVGSISESSGSHEHRDSLSIDGDHHHHNMPPTKHLPPLQAIPGCDCAPNVFKILRLLKPTTASSSTFSPASSHNTLSTIRIGIDLVETLLTCPVCYDLSKPPCITIQNVLLLGRLIFGITTSYRRYLRWFKESYAGSGGASVQGVDKGSGNDTVVYLRPPMARPYDGSGSGDDSSNSESEVGLGLDMDSAALLSFQISASQFQDLIFHGLRADAQRLSGLGRQFALRQLNRHIIGHEACPKDTEGTCWKEEQYGGVGTLDPLDICPQNPAARILTPCFRVVDVAEALIKQVVEAAA